MLDSSPVALPPPARPLKRSASLASLPTPPRTRHRTGKKRGRSLASDSECDSADGVSTDSCGEDAKENGSERVDDCKRRRTLDILDDEDAFWLGEEHLERRGGALGKYGSLKAVAPEPEPEANHDQPLVYQRLQQHQDRADAVNCEKAKVASESATSIAPVSPPPSNRKAVRVGRTLELDTAASSRTASTAPVHSPPVTPRPTNKGKKRLQRVLELPERDSPHNPFLDSPSDDCKAKPPRTPTSLEEKPTITYVLYVHPIFLPFHMRYNAIFLPIAVAFAESTRIRSLTMRKSARCLLPQNRSSRLNTQTTHQTCVAHRGSSSLHGPPRIAASAKSCKSYPPPLCEAVIATLQSTAGRTC